MSSGATLYRWVGKQMGESLNFTANDAGVAAFAEYLQLAESHPVYVLVDVVEEDFRLDTVPHVFGRDRTAVLQNKQSRLFRDSRYAQAIHQGREPDGRRDDRFLFSSIIRPEILDPWLAQLHRFKIPIVGIYSLPLVSGSLLKRIPIAADNALLVSLQSRSGLRQTYFEQGHLKVSRLATLPQLEPNRLASYVLQEVERVRRYLNSLRLLNRGGPLDVFLLGHGNALADLERQAKGTVNTRFHLVDIEDVAESLGGTGLVPAGQPYADRLFAHLLAREEPPHSYASSQDTRYYSLRRAGTAMTAIGLLGLVGSIGWSAFEFAQAVDSQLEIGTLAKQANFYQQRYERGKEQLPKLPADGKNIQRAVEMVGTIGGYRSSPLPMMSALSRGLDEFPGLVVSAVEWEASADPGGARATVTRRERRPSGRGTRNRPREPEAVRSVPYFQIAKLQGRIEPFDGDYRGALERVNRFADRLGSFEGVESVNVLKLPLEIGSRQRLSGVASAGAAVGQALFELRVVLRTHDDTG